MTLAFPIENVPVLAPAGRAASPASQEIKRSIARLQPGQSFVVPPELRGTAIWRVTDFNQKAGQRIIHTLSLPDGSLRVGMPPATHIEIVPPPTINRPPAGLAARREGAVRDALLRELVIWSVLLPAIALGAALVSEIAMAVLLDQQLLLALGIGP